MYGICLPRMWKRCNGMEKERLYKGYSEPFCMACFFFLEQPFRIKDKNRSYYEAVQTVHTKHMSQTLSVLQQL
jgi:hypothetical protein